MKTIRVTVVETAPFEADARKAFTIEERLELCTMIAENPERGDLMVGTGGCRKLRFAPTNRGKSGAYRVIYVYSGRKIPIFLLALFAKNEKSNLTDAEKNAIAKVVRRIVKEYGAKP